MTDKKTNLFRIFTTVNVLCFWLWAYSSSTKCEYSHGLTDDRLCAIEEMLKAHREGKRYTYCDGMKHLIKDHGYDSLIPNECFNIPLTAMDELQAMGMAY